MGKSISLLTLLMMSIFCISFVLAQQQTLGSFNPGSVVNLIQTCDNSTYSNITRVIYPNSSFAINTPIIMTKVGDNYNYSFNLTTSTGVYLVYGNCDENGVKTSWTYDFSSGKIVSLSNIGVYLLFLIFCLGMVVYSARLIVKTKTQSKPISHQELYEKRKRNEFMYLISVLKSKLWIVGVFGVYLFLLLFLVLANQLVYNIGLMDLNNLLINIVQIMSWGLIPFCIFWLAYVIIYFYQTTVKVMRYQFGAISSRSSQ